MLLRIKYSTHGQKSSYQQLGINLINLGSMRKKPSPLNRITTEWQSTEKTNCLNHMLGINSLWQLMLALSGTQLQREVNWLKTFTIVINFLMELWEKTLRQLTFYLHRLCSIVFTWNLTEMCCVRYKVDYTNCQGIREKKIGWYKCHDWK